LGRRIRLAELTLSVSSGGIEERVSRILAGLDREEFAPIWIAFEDKSAPLFDRAGPGVEQHLVGARDHGRLDRAGIERLVAAIRRAKPDLIHVHNWSTAFYGILAARWAGIPSVIFGSGGRDSPEGPRKKQRAVMHALAPLVDRFTTVCDFLGDEMAEGWGVARSAVTVIPTGIDVERIKRKVDRAGARRTLQIPEDALLIGTNSMFRAVKRLEDLIDAAAIVARDDPRVHLLIIGADPEPPYGIPEAIRSRPSARELGERLHLPGRIEGASAMLGAFDVWVSCSIFEGSSNAILEAMASALPIVATAVGGTPELVTDGVTGLLVEPARAEQRARALSTLLTDESLRKRVSAAALHRVEERHGLDRMVENYTRLYRAEAGRRARRITHALRSVRGLLRGSASLLGFPPHF
jgi:glycosyltransferase involved in cell wall biosynthesis